MLSAASDAYNKSILGLSTTIIGFTFAILKFSTDKPIQNVCQLKISWIFFVITIFFILFSFIAIQLHAQHRIKYINSVIDENDIDVQHWSDHVLSWSLWVSGSTFIIAIIYFVIFCLGNLTFAR
ncbi:MAG: hypothetical protein JO131_04640 [Gammaproteobacteria bacterium]|nr:hypothetical protein [Gammaproteobacteria bacterium]